jgi:hypothetical protein
MLEGSGDRHVGLSLAHASLQRGFHAQDGWMWLDRGCEIAFVCGNCAIKPSSCVSAGLGITVTISSWSALKTSGQSVFFREGG